MEDHQQDFLRGAEQASHLVTERTVSVHIQVYNPETPGLEIVDQAAVVEVNRDPTGACKLVVQMGCFGTPLHSKICGIAGYAPRQNRRNALQI
jgi:hypothetical protein